MEADVEDVEAEVEEILLDVELIELEVLEVEILEVEVVVPINKRWHFFSYLNSVYKGAIVFSGITKTLSG